jgi:hypothetical protein
MVELLVATGDVGVGVMLTSVVLIGPGQPPTVMKQLYVPAFNVEALVMLGF